MERKYKREMGREDIREKKKTGRKRKEKKRRGQEGRGEK